MQKYDRVVYVSIPNGELIDLGKTIRQFRDDGTAYHEGGEMNGLLIYGDGYIFHCFECRQGNMDKLKQDLFNYPHHHNHQLIYETYGVAPIFNTWELIYAINEPRIQAFMQKHGWDKFNPYRLKGELADEFMQIVASYSNVHKPAFHHPNENIVTSALAADQQAKTSYLITAIGIVVVMALLFYALKYFNIVPESGVFATK